jgi:hypothetical protein
MNGPFTTNWAFACLLLGGWAGWTLLVVLGTTPHAAFALTLVAVLFTAAFMDLADLVWRRAHVLPRKVDRRDD